MNTTKIVLIDHKDSFTYNIIEVLRKIGSNTTTVISYTDLVVNDLITYDKIILSPGPCLPKNYPKTLLLLEKYYKTKPILGICLGHQAICSFFGAELYNLEKVVHGINRKIQILKKSILYKNIGKETEVGLYHSWAVNNHNFPTELSVTSFTDDKIIMSVEHITYPIYGIQFHPESFLTTHGEKILRNFIQ